MFCRRSRALSRETRASSPARLRLSSAGGRWSAHPLLSVSAQTPMPHVGAKMTVASIWSSQIAPCRAVGRRRPATTSWPPVRPWSLESVATTPWLPTMPPEMPSMESEMFAQSCAVVRRAQQQCPALSGWEPVAWKKQLLPPPGNSPKSRRGAQRFVPSC